MVCERREAKVFEVKLDPTCDWEGTLISKDPAKTASLPDKKRCSELHVDPPWSMAPDEKWLSMV